MHGEDAEIKNKLKACSPIDGYLPGTPAMALLASVKASAFRKVIDKGPHLFVFGHTLVVPYFFKKKGESVQHET